MQRLLAALALGAVVVACTEQATAPRSGTPSFAATSAWTEEVTIAPAGDYKFYGACMDDILDEVGPVLLRYHTVTTNDGALFSLQVRPLEGYHLVGDKTGIWNPVPPQEGQITERIPGAVGSYTFHYTLMQGFVNEASGTRIFWPTRTKVTITPDGRVTVERGVWDACNIVGR